MARRELGRCAALATAPCSLHNWRPARQKSREMLMRVLRCGVVPRPWYDVRAGPFSSRRPWNAPGAAPMAYRSFAVLTQQCQAQASFARYTYPYLPPGDRHTWPPELHDMADALARHDDDACWRQFVLCRANSTTIPYSLWHGAMSLLAQGPNPRPELGLYARLDRVCERLHALFSFHAAHISTPMPPSLYQRYLYLLLKRAERLEHFEGDEWDKERVRQADFLAGAVTYAPAELETALLGRAVFRLAKFDHIPPPWLVEMLASRSDLEDDRSSAAQPFNALVEACIRLRDRSNPREPQLKMGIHVLRLAFAHTLPIRGTLVQTLLTRLGAERAQTHFDACRNPTEATLAPFDYAVPWSALLHGLARTRPEYLAQRAAVALCRLGDPRAALTLIRSADAQPYDVYAAAISALAWRARERRVGHETAMVLALDALHALREHTDLEADQQMYSELIRAWEATLLGRKTPAPDALGEALVVYAAVPPDWSARFTSFVEHVLSRMDDGPLLLPPHHTRLLALCVSQGHYALGRRLYEKARMYNPAQLPFFGSSEAPPRGLLWLFRQASKRSGQLLFAIRLYHDAAAFGYVFPHHDTQVFVRSLLAGNMWTVAQQVVLDVCAAQSPVHPAFASGVLRAFFHAGVFEPTLALARPLYAVPPDDVEADWDVTTARLDMYAACLYEASRTRLAHASAVRERLWTLFEEFRLALAHVLAHRPEDADVLRTTMQAYHGAIRLRVVATPDYERSEAEMARVQALLDELRGLVGDTPSLATIAHETAPHETVRSDALLPVTPLMRPT